MGIFNKKYPEAKAAGESLAAIRRMQRKRARIQELKEEAMMSRIPDDISVYREYNYKNKDLVKVLGLSGGINLINISQNRETIHIHTVAEE